MGLKQEHGQIVQVQSSKHQSCCIFNLKTKFLNENFWSDKDKEKLGLLVVQFIETQF
jgi:hypothetical protein